MDTIYVVFIVIFLVLVILILLATLAYLYMQLRQAQGQSDSVLQIKIEKTIKEYENRIREINLVHQGEINKARQQSVAVSRHTIKGQIAEQMAPLLKGFPYSPSDSRFIGDPIDYLVIRGYTDLRDKKTLNDDFEIVIVDIKHNTASLSPGQRAIAKAVEEGKVRFEVIRVMEDGTVKIFPYAKTKTMPLSLEKGQEP